MTLKKFTLSTILFLAVFLNSKEGFAGPVPSNDTVGFCDTTLWAHVYHNYRLIVHNPCMSITGHVEDIYSEADGDYHMRLTLDPQYTYLMNSVNISDEFSCLVCEPICAAAITQTDAIAPCAGLTNTVYLPAVGEYVKVTGPYVTDNDHGWNEIHPITSCVIVTPAAVGAVSADKLSFKAFPNPANEDISFSMSDYPDAPVQIILSDALGRSAGQYQMQNTLQLKVTTGWWPVGLYYYTILQQDKVLKTGTFAVVH